MSEGIIDDFRRLLGMQHAQAAAMSSEQQAGCMAVYPNARALEGLANGFAAITGIQNVEMTVMEAEWERARRRPWLGAYDIAKRRDGAKHWDFYKSHGNGD